MDDFEVFEMLVYLILPYWLLIIAIAELCSQLCVVFYRVWIGVNDKKQEDKYETLHPRGVFR